MKALSVRQPWAWAILHAGKDIENRQWPTRQRGRVLVHASKAMTRFELMDFQDFTAAMSPQPPIAGATTDELVFGALLGTVEVVDCVTASASPWFQGKYGFVLREPRPFPQPIPYLGKLSFFDVPDDVIAV